MTKYFATQSGDYIGAFDGADPPVGAIEVPMAPATAADKWNGTGWDAAPPPVPAAITMRQARLALLGAGLLAQVNDAVAAMGGAAGSAARIEWEYAQEVSRNSLLVSYLSAALGLSAAQLDDLFIQASML